MSAAQRRLLERLREAEREGACNIQCQCGESHHVMERCQRCGAFAPAVLRQPRSAQ